MNATARPTGRTFEPINFKTRGRLLNMLNGLRHRGRMGTRIWIGVDPFFVLSGSFARHAVRISPVFHPVAVLLLLRTPISMAYEWFERRFPVLKRHFEYSSETAEHRHAFQP